MWTSSASFYICRKKCSNSLLNSYTDPSSPSCIGFCDTCTLNQIWWSSSSYYTNSTTWCCPLCVAHGLQCCTSSARAVVASVRETMETEFHRIAGLLSAHLSTCIQYNYSGNVPTINISPWYTDIDTRMWANKWLEWWNMWTAFSCVLWNLPYCIGDLCVYT